MVGKPGKLATPIPKNPLAANLNYIVESCASPDDGGAIHTTVEVSNCIRFIGLRVTTVL